MSESYLPTRAWVEVDLDRIAANARTIRRLVHPRADVMGVVKADAYGHGVRDVVPVLLENGISRLAVSMLDEAIQLRRDGVRVPILVLGYTDPRRAEEILHHDVTQTVFSRDLAQALSDAAVRMARPVRIHVKIDTGMGRVGFMAGFGAIKDIAWIGALPGLVIEGLYTHFSSADEADPAFTLRQFEQFMGISAELGRIGLHIPLQHCCNSAALLRFPRMHLDLVRPGLILYGLLPAHCGEPGRDLRPAMTLKADVVLVKDVDPGTPISYGRTFVTGRPSRIATLPVGYADGYLRSLSGKASVLLRGRRVPVVGRVCMDSCLLDVTDLPDPPAVGDEAVLFGCQRAPDGDEACLPIEEVADWLGTISYEVACLIGRRIPRSYLRDGRLRAVARYLLPDSP